MRDYMKPVVIVNSEVSEGVYAASGSADECYTVNAYIHQRPQLGRGDYPESFACVVGRDNVFATQFHTEKSHDAGLQLLQNFMLWDGQA